MKSKPTERGFANIEFTDRYGAKCSIQKSSIATEDCIWLGIDDVDPKIMGKNDAGQSVGWVKYPIHEDVLLSGRMHLSQEQVRDLLPYLQKFAVTGEL
jgi:hypothetical protein